MQVTDAADHDSPNCSLTPYLASHVPLYHEWMADKELRELTASERLTLEEEYDMQKKWTHNPSFITFIILDNTIEGSPPAGDVNIFLSEEDGKILGELNVMIAERKSRRKGLAKQALLQMMKIGKESHKIKKFVAKIQQTNIPSIKLFQGLGFTEESRSEVWKEITFIYNVKEEEESSA